MADSVEEQSGKARMGRCLLVTAVWAERPAAAGQRVKEAEALELGCELLSRRLDWKGEGRGCILRTLRGLRVGVFCRWESLAC